MLTAPYPLPSLIAHRGASAHAPENTLASFQKAYEMGAGWIEFDVMLTQDGIPIIFHDDTTTRTTNQADLKISQLTLKEIKRLDAGSWFSPEFTGESIPTLEEVLLWMKSRQMLANIEIKPAEGQEVETAEVLLSMLDKHWTDAKWPLISSFKTLSLQVIRERNKMAPLGLLKDMWDIADLSLLTELSCRSIHLYHKHLTHPETISTIKKLGFGVLCYTIDDPARAQQFFNWGVDGIFTNRPELLKNIA